MDQPFLFRRAGTQFFDELEVQTTSGNSSIILGVRGIGKSQCMEALLARLTKDSSNQVISVSFRRGTQVIDVAELCRMIEAAVRPLMPQGELPKATPERLLAPVEYVIKHSRRPMILLASNVDGIVQHLAHRLLRELRVLVSGQKLIVVLTGEDQLAPLVVGADSDFNCAQHYLLQGFDKEEFFKQVSERIRISGIKFEHPAACAELLWEQARGNICVARASLWAVQEKQIHGSLDSSVPVSSADFARTLTVVSAQDSLAVEGFHRISRVISRRPDCWGDLARMIKGEVIKVEERSPPLPLELTGLVMRTGGQLWFASPWAEKMARIHFDAARMGDLHAAQGDWDNAFMYYERLAPDERLRSVGRDEQSHIEMAVKVFTSEFHSLAPENPSRQLYSAEERVDRLRAFFVRGCSLLLGVRHVQFWMDDGKGWKRVPAQSDNPVGKWDTAMILLEQLRAVNKRKPDQVLSASTGVVGTFKSAETGEFGAVTLIDDGLGGMPRARRMLLERVVQEFAIAWDYVIHFLQQQRDSERRRRHVQVTADILRAIGTSLQDPMDALKQAGNQLLSRGYRRVFFSLVNVEQTYIRGTVDCTIKDCGNADFVGETGFALSEPGEDIQPWVATNLRPVQVIDWQGWNDRERHGLPPINLELARRAKTARCFAVIPMMEASAKTATVAMGTMHVERIDERPLSQEELLDLLDFGQFMAVAVAQSERIHALKAALDSDPDAVAIITDKLTLRLANERASERLGLPKGWSEDDAIKLDPDKPSQTLVVKLAKKVLKDGKTRIRHVTPVHGGTDDRYFIRCSPLPSWLPKSKTDRAEEPPDRQRACVIEIRDLSEHDILFNALQKVAASARNSTDSVESILAAVHSLGHDCIRFYKVTPEEIYSARAFGMPEEIQAQFAAGYWRMSCKAAETKDTWRCFREREPCIHQYDPTLLESCDLPPTGKGLRRFGVRDPGFTFANRKAGDMWLDIPLFANGVPYGKIVIDCGEGGHCEISGEELELLRIFSALLGALLHGMDSLDAQKRWANNAIDKAISMTAHSIGNLFFGLRGLGRRYEKAAPGNARVKRWNSLHDPIINETSVILRRVLDIFKDAIKARPTLCHAATLLDQACKTYGQIQAGQSPRLPKLLCDQTLQVLADGELLKIAIGELLSNAQNMKPEGLEIEIEASMESRHDRDWTIIQVRDNGPGLDSSIKDSAFDFMVSSRPGGVRSTGLGLAHVRKIIEAHKGDVRFVESPAPWGAIVEMRLPFPPPPVPITAPTLPDEPCNSPTPQPSSDC